MNLNCIMSMIIIHIVHHNIIIIYSCTIMNNVTISYSCDYCYSHDYYDS